MNLLGISVDKGILAQQHRFPNYHTLRAISQNICLKTPQSGATITVVREYPRSLLPAVGEEGR
jgi:hypothetical protein